MSLRRLAVAAIVCASTFVRADRISPIPPAPPAPPTSPTSPSISFSATDAGITVEGMGTYVDRSIDRALRGLDRPGIPGRVRKKLRARLEALRGRLRRQLSHLDARDIEQLGEEMGRIGEEMAGEMEHLGEDMDPSRRPWQAVKPGRYRAGSAARHDTDDDDDDLGGSPTDVDDDEDVDDMARGLGTLSLQGEQREEIAHLREVSEHQIADAKQALEAAERELHDLLDNPASNDAAIARAVDAVSQQEAAIRKARLLAWHAARRVLDEDQRRRIEEAVRGHGK
jgi:hypothetical protein